MELAASRAGQQGLFHIGSSDSMVSSYQISSETVAQIKLLEGFRARATPLEDGLWAVGYGHVASTLRTSIVTRAQADLLLRYDLNIISEALSGLVYTPLNSNQIDALASFVYNIGLEAFEGSTVLRLINAGAMLEAASAMEQWCHATVAGQWQELDGLIRRRAMEKALFLKPDGGWVPVPSRLVVPYANAPCLSHDRTTDQVFIDVEKIAEVAPTAEEAEGPAQMALDADLLPQPRSAGIAEAIAASDPTADETVHFPETPSVARRAAASKSVARSKRKGSVRPLDYGHLAILGLIALGALAAMGFAFSLAMDADVAVRQNPQTLARAWAIGITGLLALSVAVALLFRMLNPRA
jgi:GH24 family phage-related lysozyme (muramidase)